MWGVNMRKKIIVVCSLVLAASFFSGCSTLVESKQISGNEGNSDSSVLGNIQKTFDEAVAPNKKHKIPDEVMGALLPNADIDISGGSLKSDEQRFNLAVNRADAKSFFVSLVKDTPYNMMVHPEVKGKITLNLKNVTINEVMQMVYDVYGYEYDQTPSGFMVRPNKIQSKIFEINYLNITRSGHSETRVSSGQPTEKSSSSSGNTSSITRSTSQSILAGSNIKTNSHVDFWSEIESAVLTIIGEGLGRSVVVSPQSGLVVVKAYPDELRKVQRYLDTAEKIMQRQVILEAKIIEVELKDGYQQGINWASLDNSGEVLSGQTGGGSLLENGISEIAGNVGNLDPSNYIQLFGNAVSAFGGMFTLAVNSGDFTAFFEFLKTQGNLQVLSSPRIATVNNQKAVIKVGSDEFFVTDVSSTTTSGVTTTTTPDVTLTPFFSGIALDVTPQIDINGKIILHIHPTISEVVDQEKTIDITSQVLTLPLAFSQVRESDSIVSANNGQIVVIGGLMKNKIVQTESSTPIISSLPYLGELFKHKKEKKLKSELVILLRPLVLENGDEWTRIINGSSGRVRDIYQNYD